MWCPLRPLSSFEVHERLRRTKRRRSGYSLPFLLSRGVLPFPVEARTGEPLHGPFTITVIVDGDRQKERRAAGRPAVAKWGRNVPHTHTHAHCVPLPRSCRFCRETARRRAPMFLGQLFLLRHCDTSFFWLLFLSSFSPRFPFIVVDQFLSGPPAVRPPRLLSTNGTRF